MTITKNAAGEGIIVELTLTGEVVHEYSRPLGAYPYTFSPDGRKFLYSGIHSDIHGKWILRDLVTSTEEILFDPEKTEHLVHLVNPAFSPDGKVIAFSHITYTEQGGDVKLCLVTVPQGLHSNDCLETEGAFPAFSPDGSKLAYWELTKQQPNSAWNLLIREISTIGLGGPAKTLATKSFQGIDTSLWVGPIGWSPDSQWVVWSERDDIFDTYYKLFRKHVEGSEAYRIKLKRPWWTILSRYFVLADQIRVPVSFYWAPVSNPTGEK